MNAPKNVHNASALRHTIINVLLIAMIVFLYYAMGQADAIDVLSSDVIYRTGAQNKISLECVVAWESEYVDDVLTVFEERNVTASFVVSGAWARENPELMRKIVNGGHEIATCGMQYSDTEQLETAALAASLFEASRVIESVCGEKASYYYCPTGDTAKASRAADKAGLSCVRCTVDLLSARGSAAQIAQRAKESARGRSIIAFTPTVNMVQALPEILDFYAESGFHTGAVS